MATLDNYAPYATGMSARDAVQALWNAKNLGTNFCKVISSNTPPQYTEISNDGSFWYNPVTNKIYRAVRNTSTVTVLYFEV